MVDKLRIEKLSVFYGTDIALKNINIEVHENEILSLIGPSRSGKTTLMKAINRMIDLVPNVKIEGRILFDKSIVNLHKTSITVISNCYATFAY